MRIRRYGCSPAVAGAPGQGAGDALPRNAGVAGKSRGHELGISTSREEFGISHTHVADHAGGRDLCLVERCSGGFSTWAIRSAASRTERTTPAYPVQRQILPASAVRISVELFAAPRRIMSRTVISMPGVQSENLHEARHVKQSRKIIAITSLITIRSKQSSGQS